jgi:hypothetical protein
MNALEPVVQWQGMSADKILSLRRLDSAGYLVASMAWLDYYLRFPAFGPLLSACTTGRHGIEYLFFESLFLGLGYEQCEKEYAQIVNRGADSIQKLLKQRVPHYQKLQRFSVIVASLDAANLPQLVEWDHADLMKGWGKLSNYLHWFEAYSRSTDDLQWLNSNYAHILGIVTPIWNKLLSGRKGLMHPDDMHSNTRMVWDEYASGNLTDEQVKIRLEIVRPPTA